MNFVLTDHIRAQTQAYHQRLENCLYLKPLGSSQNISERLYKEIITSLYGVIKPLEVALQQAKPRYHPEALTLVYQPRYPYLEADLQTLQLPPDLIAVDNEIVTINSCESYIAVYYMLEGSKLGARYISQFLKQSSPSLPRQYFDSGWSTQQSWQQVCHQLNQLTTIDQQQLVSSLIVIYQRMIQWLDTKQSMLY